MGARVTPNPSIERTSKNCFAAFRPPLMSNVRRHSRHSGASTNLSYRMSVLLSQEVSMPSTVIEVRRSYAPEQEVRIIEAVQAALVEGFKIPVEDRCVRLVTYEPHRFICSPERTQPESYTLVTVTAFSGRSLDAKRNLYRGIVQRLGELDIPADHVKIILNEVPRENWGLAGGKPASEIELGFKVEV